MFGINPYMFIGHPGTPDVIRSVATIPLAFGMRLIAGSCGANEEKWDFVRFRSALLTGITAFIGMYIFGLPVAHDRRLYTLCICGEQKMASRPRFWKGVSILLLAVAGAISLIRVYPMIANAQLLGEVRSRKGD